MKMRKRVISLLGILSVTAVLLAGCGKTDLSSSVFCGKWKASTASYNDMKMKVESILGEYVITLNGDGTAVVTLNDMSKDGTWDETEKGVALQGGISGGMELRITSSGKLVLDQDDVRVVFLRQ